MQLALLVGRPETVDAFATWARDALALPGALPTAAGERVVEHAREILAGLDAIRWAANAARGLEWPAVLRLAEPLYRRFGLQVSERARGPPAARALLEVAAPGQPRTEAAAEARTATTAAAQPHTVRSASTPTLTAKR